MSGSRSTGNPARPPRTRCAHWCTCIGTSRRCTSAWRTAGILPRRSLASERVPRIGLHSKTRVGRFGYHRLMQSPPGSPPGSPFGPPGTPPPQQGFAQQPGAQQQGFGQSQQGHPQPPGYPQPQGFAPAPGYGAPPQGYPPPQGFQQPQGYPPPNGFGPPQQPPQAFGTPPFPQQQPFGSSPTTTPSAPWKWRYSPFVGVMYGPIPVGVIFVAIGLIGYFASQQ